jgi:ArsR family transcriptional regulator
MDEITELQAEILKTLASPRRLDILHRIAAGPVEVGRLADELGLAQPNVSQHLAVLRTAGLVEAEREGREVRYRLSDPDVMVACGVMRRVLERRLDRLAALVANGSGSSTGDASTARDTTTRNATTTTSNTTTRKPEPTLSTR